MDEKVVIAPCIMDSMVCVGDSIPAIADAGETDRTLQ